MAVSKGNIYCRDWWCLLAAALGTLSGCGALRKGEECCRAKGSRVNLGFALLEESLCRGFETSRRYFSVRMEFRGSLHIERTSS